MERIRVALFSSRAEAYVIRQRLARAGIEAELHDELGVARFWFVSRSAAGVRLEVAAAQAEQATQRLHEWDSALGALRGAIRCPECRSLRVDYPQFTRKSILPNVAMGLLAEVGLLEKECYCEDCHCMWTKQRTNPRPDRRHMAPWYFLE
jgi:predicted Zn-ribbon and HTH transcriptional regulator